MIFIFASIFFALGLVISAIGGVMRLKIKNYLDSEYSENPLSNYYFSSFIFRLNKFISVYKENMPKDQVIEKFISRYKIISYLSFIFIIVAIVLILINVII